MDEQYWREDQKLDFKHVKGEVLIRHPNRLFK